MPQPIDLEIAEDQSPDCDILFGRGPDQYMLVILDGETGQFQLVQDPKGGPSGKHWGEIRVLDGQMKLIGVKLMTIGDASPSNPYTPEILDAVSESLGERLDAIMIAGEVD